MIYTYIFDLPYPFGIFKKVCIQKSRFTRIKWNYHVTRSFKMFIILWKGWKIFCMNILVFVGMNMFRCFLVLYLEKRICDKYVERYQTYLFSLTCVGLQSSGCTTYVHINSASWHPTCLCFLWSCHLKENFASLAVSACIVRRNNMFYSQSIGHNELQMEMKDLISVRALWEGCFCHQAFQWEFLADDLAQLNCAINTEVGTWSLWRAGESVTFIPCVPLTLPGALCSLARTELHEN